MTLVSPSQSNPGDEITANSVNVPVNQIATVVNGNIDDTNISAVSGSKVSAGTLPASSATTDANVETRLSESLGNFVASGAIWSIVSGLNGAMSSGIVYIGGKRVVVSSIASQAFVASKDTYVSVDNTGAVSIASAVANGAAAPSLPANSIWLAKVVTGASITRVELGGNGGSGIVIYPTSVASAWQDYTPTWTNLTVGNGTVTARYKQIGKTVFMRLLIVWGSTTSASSTFIAVSLPATATANLGTGQVIGSVKANDGTNPFQGPLTQLSTTTGVLRWFKVQGSGIKEDNITPTTPNTWTTGNEFFVTADYEAA